MLYSIGHSNLSQDDFVASVSKADIVLDVRSHPTSCHEQFRKQQLESYLGQRYRWEPALGGWTERHLDLPERLMVLITAAGINVSAYAGGKFPKQRICRDRHADGTAWINLGLYEYSYFMVLPEFLVAVDDLIERTKSQDVVMFCCECQWWCCHRSMIADYVVWRGADVSHLMPRQRQRNRVKYIDGTRETLHSAIIDNRLERYDRCIIDEWSNRRIGRVYRHILKE